MMKQLTDLRQMIGRTVTKVSPINNDRVLIGLSDDTFMQFKAVRDYDEDNELVIESPFNRVHYSDETLRNFFGQYQLDLWIAERNEARRQEQARYDELERAKYEALKAKYEPKVSDKQ